MDKSGTLAINNGFGVHLLCSISEDHPDSAANARICNGWYALVTGAKLTGATVRVYYSDNTGKGGVDACSEIGSWVWPEDKIYYVSIIEE